MRRPSHWPTHLAATLGCGAQASERRTMKRCLRPARQGCAAPPTHPSAARRSGEAARSAASGVDFRRAPELSAAPGAPRPLRVALSPPAGCPLECRSLTGFILHWQGLTFNMNPCVALSPPAGWRARFCIAPLSIIPPPPSLEFRSSVGSCTDRV